MSWVQRHNAADQTSGEQTELTERSKAEGLAHARNRLENGVDDSEKVHRIRYKSLNGCFSYKRIFRLKEVRSYSERSANTIFALLLKKYTHAWKKIF